jgi:hypothetical protein
VFLVIVADQGEGDRKIVQRIGSQQQRVFAQMNLVDTQGAREVRQGPVPVGSTVDLTNLLCVVPRPPVHGRSVQSSLAGHDA